MASQTEQLEKESVESTQVALKIMVEELESCQQLLSGNYLL